MTRIFVELPSFRAEWKKMGLTEADLLRLQQELLANPEVGSKMQGTGGVRKMRFAFEHRGKSGSIRICYVDFEKLEIIYLLAIFPKNEQENLSQAERNILKKKIDILEESLK